MRCCRAFTLAWRLDVAETVGAGIGQVCGVRPAAARLGVPYTTARRVVAAVPGAHASPLAPYQQ
jgi:hypothetical protein